jgi:hypothetical protein
MAPRKKIATKDATPASTIQETPIVFFLRTEDVATNDIAPAGHTMGYADISKGPSTMTYTDILKSMEQSTPMNTDILKALLEKTVTDTYPSDTVCFWCCHSFEWTPAVLPSSYDAYKNVYVCEGHFCSPECGLSYLYEMVNTSDTTRWNRHSLLRALYTPLYTKRELNPAPPRTTLRMFGGPLDIAQFRSYTSSVNDFVVSELPPIRLVFPTMNIQGPIRDVKKYVSLSTDVVEKASQQLRLKRSKPIHANIPTLDMCLKAH